VSCSPRSRILWLAALVLVAAVLLMVARHHHAGVPVPAASRSLSAPDFSLTQLNGTPLRLADYADKVVLLDFWATWCAPCREEIPRFVEWQAKYGNQGLQVIGVSMDGDVQPVQRFSRKFRMNYPVMMGNQELASRYGGILGLPANIVIGRDGRILSKHLGMEDLSLLEKELTDQLATKEESR
jgi:cytochrome c biogenesis protein CcmG, thiol:disulfide interchange protein DsbE